MVESALRRVIVLDATSGVNGAYATKLLADLGARVILLEDEIGNPLRRRPPVAEREYSVIWAHLAGGKESLVMPMGADAGPERRRLLRDWCSVADILVCDGTSSLEGDLPNPLPPRVIEIDVSPFGRVGPYATWRGSDIATWAMGGYMYFTGEKARPPLSLSGSQSELHAGTHAAFAALAALYEQRRSGWGQQIEISDLESALSAHAWLISSWAASGQLLDRDTHDLTRCADGWVFLMTLAPNPNIFLVMDKPELMDDPIATELQNWDERLPEIRTMFQEWAADKEAAEIAAKAQALRVACTPVLDAAGLAADPHTQARGYWEEGDSVWAQGDAGTVRFPGQPYRFPATPAGRRGGAPTLGQHSEALRSELSTSTTAASARPAQPEQHAPPLRGLRVVELTANWAGPIAGRQLADLGADVIKVEWAARPATRALFWPGPELDFQRQGWNRSMYFNHLNRNKRDVVIDLQQERGKEVFKKLVRNADVLIENNSARVMPNLGLGWADLKQINPSLIMVSMSGFGATGPSKDWVAYGSNIETTSGLTAITGDEPDGPRYRTTLFYADPVAGIHGAVAIMAALEHRRVNGQGQWIDISLNEVGASFCFESLLSYQASGELRQPMGNRDPRFAPQGAYGAVGIDKWVAVSVQDNDDWVALCAVIGRPDLAADPTLGCVEGRWRNHDAIDEAINAWTQGLEQYESAWALQRAGVSAAPVLANWQMLPDPHLHGRGFFVDIEHPVVGVYPYASWPWRFARTPASIRRAAPVFAEHNRDVFLELGLTMSEIDALYADGVTADEPLIS